MNTWLIIDSDFMCHRAMHSFGNELHHEDVKTGIVFGYLRMMQLLEERFEATGSIHCFNHGRNQRLDLFPAYKQHRKRTELSDEEVLAWKEFDKQRELLKTDYLPQISQNVFYQDGYESDDIMAAVKVSPPDDAVMVTSDRDMLQCIRPNIVFFDPQHTKLINEESFARDHGYPAQDYWKVLVLAGCSTDGVPGIPKIGKKTAEGYVAKTPIQPWRKALLKEGFKEAIKRNKPLVKLPMEGCSEVIPVPEDLSVKAWNSLCRQLGFKSLRKKPDGQRKRKLV